MTENRGLELQPGVGSDAEIDLADPAIAWNFGTRELTEDEYAEFAAEARRDWAAADAAREGDEAYAAWKAANPEEAERQEAEFRARWAGSGADRAWELEPEAEID